MITVAQATEKIINRSRYLSEAISKGLINTSALARYIKPEVDEMLVKDVSEAAILMAINRLSKQLTPKYSPHTALKEAPEMILRSQLSLFVYKKSDTAIQTMTTLLHLPQTNQTFSLFSMQNTFLFVCSKDITESTQKTLKQETLIKEQKGISVLSIFLPNEVLHTPGIYYFFLKSLAWEGINIIEISSIENEMILILEDKDAQHAYAILQSLFTK
jgi:hypothetical protein